MAAGARGDLRGAGVGDLGAGDRGRGAVSLDEGVRAGDAALSHLPSFSRILATKACSLLARRVIATGREDAPQVEEPRSIEMKHFNGRPPARRLPDDPRKIGAPLEMV